jgi:hypothetical protein
MTVIFTITAVRKSNLTTLYFITDNPSLRKLSAGTVVITCSEIGEIMA